MIGNEHVRFALIKHGSNPLIVFGINPSTADANKPDNTMNRVLGLANRNGYDGFIMLNIYPLRATDFNKLPSEINQALHDENISTIKHVLSNISNPDILLAFGNHILDRKYLKSCLKNILTALRPLAPHYYQLGELTSKCCPRHPLYVANTINIKECNIDILIK
ncbi:MAG: DUF1643 domain-containing protein [Muribaculaceae bacterium]